MAQKIGKGCKDPVIKLETSPPIPSDDTAVYSLKWTIPKFNPYRTRMGKYLKSEMLTTQMIVDKHHSFFLKLYPNGITASCKGFISLYLHYMNNDDDGPAVSCSCSVMDSSDICSNERTFHHKLGKLDQGFDRFLRKRKLFVNKEELLPEKNLTIFCKVEILNYIRILPKTPIHTELPKKLLEDDLFSDITLKASGGEMFKAHKCILALCSSVFRAMLQHKMKELSSNQIDICDIEAAQVKDMLEFMYTGTALIENDISAQKLVIAADKYDLKKLKLFCADYMQRHIKEENVFDILIIADMVHEKGLKNSCIDYICHRKLMKKDHLGGCEKLKSKPELMIDIFQKY